MINSKQLVSNGTLHFNDIQSGKTYSHKPLGMRAPYGGEIYVTDGGSVEYYSGIECKSSMSLYRWIKK